MEGSCSSMWWHRNKPPVAWSIEDIPSIVYSWWKYATYSKQTKMNTCFECFDSSVKWVLTCLCDDLTSLEWSDSCNCYIRALVHTNISSLHVGPIVLISELHICSAVYTFCLVYFSFNYFLNSLCWIYTSYVLVLASIYLLLLVWFNNNGGLLYFLAMLADSSLLQLCATIGALKQIWI